MSNLSNIINANNNELYSTSTNNFPYYVRHVETEGRWPPSLPQMPMPIFELTRTSKELAFTNFQKQFKSAKLL